MLVLSRRHLNGILSTIVFAKRLVTLLLVGPSVCLSASAPWCCGLCDWFPVRDVAGIK